MGLASRKTDRRRRWGFNRLYPLCWIEGLVSFLSSLASAKPAPLVMGGGPFFDYVERRVLLGTRPIDEQDGFHYGSKKV